MSDNFRILSLGSDPELILTDSSGSPVSAVGLFERTASARLYPDNVLAEFSHKPVPMHRFASHITTVMSELSSTLSAKGLSYTVGQCQATYSDDQLSVPEAHAIGCSPFSNAYNLGVNSVPRPYTDNNRYAGGHLHIGYDTETLPPHLLVQLLDEHLLPLDPNHGKTARSDFYGAPGSYRQKPYGLEYRSLSNWWLDCPELIVAKLTEIEQLVNKKYYGA